jgi:hypothetical protein
MYLVRPLVREMRTRVQFRKWESNWPPVSRHVLASKAAGFATIHGSNG